MIIRELNFHPIGRCATVARSSCFFSYSFIGNLFFSNINNVIFAVIAGRRQNGDRGHHAVQVIR